VELARLEFIVIGEAGDKSVIDIHGILGNLAVESIEAIWMSSEVIVFEFERRRLPYKTSFSRDPTTYGRGCRDILLRI
jgi:hypothetical protein